jgi:hypothetical protein
MNTRSRRRADPADNWGKFAPKLLGAAPEALRQRGSTALQGMHHSALLIAAAFSLNS